MVDAPLNVVVVVAERAAAEINTAVAAMVAVEVVLQAVVVAVPVDLAITQMKLDVTLRLSGII